VRDTRSGPAVVGEGSTGPAPEDDAEVGVFAEDDPVADEDGQLPVSWLLVGVVVVGALLLALSARGQIVPPEDLVPDPSSGPAALLVGGPVAPVATLSHDTAMATVEEALGFLRADLEPRLAVRCAYASVAAGFGQATRARRPEETEGEYLERALASFGAGGPALTRLTQLFAVARFSDEPVTGPMRQEALDALEQVRSAMDR
jgi:hypothetical protein